METKKLFEEAAHLPEADRIRLAEHVLATLDGVPDQDAADAWAKEVERRSREIDEGVVELIPWSEVKAKARRRARDGSR